MFTQTQRNLYSILNVTPEASLSEIKASYHHLAKQYHPDRNSKATKDEKIVLENKMKVINDAYGVLSDQNKRKSYDYNYKYIRKSQFSKTNSDFKHNTNEVPQQKTYSSVPINHLSQAIDDRNHNEIAAACRQLQEHNISIPFALLIHAFKQFKKFETKQPFDPILLIIKTMIQTTSIITEDELTTLLQFECDHYHERIHLLLNAYLLHANSLQVTTIIRIVNIPSIDKKGCENFFVNLLNAKIPIHMTSRFMTENDIATVTKDCRPEIKNTVIEFFIQAFIVHNQPITTDLFSLTQPYSAESDELWLIIMNALLQGNIEVDEKPLIIAMENHPSYHINVLTLIDKLCEQNFKFSEAPLKQSIIQQNYFYLRKLCDAHLKTNTIISESILQFALINLKNISDLKYLVRTMLIGHSVISASSLLVACDTRDQALKENLIFDAMKQLQTPFDLQSLKTLLTKSTLSHHELFDAYLKAGGPINRELQNMAREYNILITNPNQNWFKNPFNSLFNWTSSQQGKYNEKNATLNRDITRYR